MEIPVITIVWFVRALALLCLLPSGDGTKVLFVVGNINSHVLLFARFADDLARLGHVTELVAPANAHLPDFVASGEMHANFKYTTYPVDGDVPFANSRATSEAFLQIALSRSIFQKFKLLSSFTEHSNAAWHSDCERLLSNEILMKRVRSDGYQFAVMDPVAMDCMYVLPYSLGIPFATLSFPMIPWFFRVPRLPSFVSTALAYSDRMSFTQRLSALALDMAMMTLVNMSTYYVQKYAPDRPPIRGLEFMERMSAWFFVEDIALGYALPQMPNTIPVGDIMAARPGLPLTGDLEKFVASSSGGVIIASFGSFIDYVPSDITEKLCDAFRRAGSEGRRVIWKFKNADVCGADAINEGRLKILPWIPQNDLLADPRVRLFVTHGGLNSLIEAVYHAKPVIVFPIAADQPFNAAAAESKRFAIRMDIGDFTADSLLAGIEEILSDRKYQDRAQFSSSLLRDRRDTPAERASHMINHVIKYGDSHLRTGAFELNALQFMMFDIFAFIFIVVLLAAVLVLSLCYLVVRKCCRHKLSVMKNYQGKAKSQ
jgi:hypothetical protein